MRKGCALSVVFYVCICLGYRYGCIDPITKDVTLPGAMDSVLVPAVRFDTARHYKQVIYQFNKKNKVTQTENEH